MKKLSLVHCQDVLLVAWLLLTLIPFAIVFIQTINGYYDGKEKDAWDWLLSKVGPTLTLMSGAVVRSHVDEAVRQRQVHALLYYLSISTVAVYFMVIYGVMLFGFRIGILNCMKLSSIPLTFVQGILTSLLGVFLVSGKTERAR